MCKQNIQQVLLSPEKKSQQLVLLSCEVLLLLPGLGFRRPGLRSMDVM